MKPVKDCGGSVANLFHWKYSGSEIYGLNMCARYQTKLKRLLPVEKKKYFFATLGRCRKIMNPEGTSFC